MQMQFLIKRDRELAIILEPAVRSAAFVEILPCFARDCGIGGRLSVLDKARDRALYGKILIIDGGRVAFLGSA